MAAAPGANAETLERLLIEVVGDDSKLRSALEDSIKAAQDAAEKMRAALNLDFGNVTQGAQAATTAFEQVTPAVLDVNKVLDAYVTEAEKAFERTRAAGVKSEEQFEEYRQAALEALESQGALARGLGYTGTALDDLAKRVREAAYAQSEQSKQSERAKQEQAGLEETIKRLTAQVSTQRNFWAGRIRSDDEFRQSTEELRAQLLGLVDAGNLTEQEMKRVSQALAYAQRGLDSVNKVASRGGLAWTTQIALTNQFGQALRGMGPAGNAAATGLGFMEGGLNRLIPRAKEGDSVFRMFGLTTLRFAAVWYPVASALIPLVGTGLLAKLSADAAKAASELEAATFRTGLTIEGLQELQHAARVAGVPMELLSTTMQRLQRRAADANAGNKGLRQSFDALGVSLTGADGKMRSTEDLLGQVADGLNKVENNADRLALAFKIFDTEGGRLLPLLSRGSEGIRELREEARRLGLVVSGDTVMSLAELDSKIQTVMQQFSVLRMEVAGAFLPVMENGLLPLVSDKLVPALQTAAGHIQEFSERFFDATEAGEAFRADTVKNLQAIVVLGKGVVAGAQAVWGAVNAIVGAGAAAFGAGQGLADWQENNELILARRADLLRQIAYMEGQLKEDWAAPGTLASVKIAEQLQRARRDLANLPANVWEAMEQGARDAGEVMVGNAIEGFTSMMDTLQTDVTAQLEALLAGVDFTRPARKAGENAGGELGAGFGAGARVALEGSLKHAQERLAKAQEELAYAVGADARAAALQTVEAWQEAVRIIEAELAKVDPARDARAWTARLTAEMERGLKTPAEVLDLIMPTIERLRSEAATALSEFGFDSDEFRKVNAPLTVLEGLLKSLGGQAKSITGPMTGVRAAIDENTTAASEFLTEQEKNRREAARILDVYSQLVQMGASLEDRMAFLEGTPFGSSLMTGPDMSDAVPLKPLVSGVVLAKTEVEQLREAIVAMLAADEGEAAVLTMIQRLTTLSPMSVAALDELTGGWYTARNAVTTYTQAAEDAFNEFPSTPPVVATLTARLTPALEAARERARALGEEFDYVAAEQAALTSVITELGNRTNLTAGELAVYEQAIARLAQLNTAKAGQATDELFRAWLEGVNRLGVNLDPLDAAALALTELDLTSEQVSEALAALAAAGDRLEQAEFTEAFGAWTESVERIGLAADPIRDAREQLAALFEGKEDLDEYRIALELLADAEERLAQLERDTAAKKAAEAWKSAHSSIQASLRVNQADFSELRKVAEDAFKYGVIGAEELDAALAAIGVMETVENFRILASELDDIQALVPELMADFTRAFAMLSAGNTTDAVAVGFRAAAQAVNALGDAFADTATQGEAMLDLVIGAAAGIATAIGGPAMGQAVGAIGQFIKSILGDLTNGLAEIQRQIDQATTRSTYLGESLIQGIADANTSRVSRGGILGFLGLTKAQLDEDAFRAAVTLAEGIANGLVNTLRAGNFEEAWKSMVDDILIQGIIERFMATTAIQEAIGEAFALLDAGNTSGAASRLEQVKSDFRFIWEQIQEITGAADQLAINVSGALTSGFQNALNSSTWADAWDSATLMMKNTLRDAIVQAFIEGEAMKKFLDRFNQALNHALQDGVISDAELKELERIFAESEGPLQELWGALEALGLGFDDLNDTVQSVTNSMSNVPSVFLDTQAMFDSVAARGGWSTSTLTQPAGAPVMNITFEGPVYGMDDFESRVTEAVNRSGWRGGLAAHGVSR